MATPPTLAVQATGLVKRYGEKTALSGIDLEVPKGSVCALLGPNGAGKTTAVRILTTLTPADEGTAVVGGIDVAKDPLGVRRSIGLAAQDATVDGLLTGAENLTMIGELHHLGRKAAKARTAELLEQFTLTDAKDRLAKEYSGGMRRRLDLAATLVASPAILFLDEPTTGLDPRARIDLWGVLDGLVGGGTTILLTTQYLEEADHLADDIVVIDHGRVIARGDARSLKREVGGEQVRVVVADASDLPGVAALLERVCETRAIVDADARSVVAPTSKGVAAVAEVATGLAGSAIKVEDLSLAQPSLDDVFLSLTGAPPEQDPAIPSTAGSAH